MTDENDRPEPDSPLGRVIAELQRPVVLTGQPVERTLAALAREPRGHWRGPLLAGLGIAATLALLFTGHAPRRPSDTTLSGKEVRFALRSQARQVSLIGDFNDWDPAATPLIRHGAEWSATLALKPGRYRYAFLVDGHQVEADPAGPAATDEFGGQSSAVTVAN